MELSIKAARIAPKGSDKERVTLLEEISGQDWSMKLYRYGFTARFWQKNKAEIWSSEE